MKRGDIVTTAISGDYGKPRPAVVVQTDALPELHGSVVICQMTSDLSGTQDFRVDVEPSDRNGLRVSSRIMADKPVTVRRERLGRKIGQLSSEDVRRLNVAFAFVMGLADYKKAAR